MEHNVNAGLTEWNCSCGRSGIILSQQNKSFACRPITEADKK